ncbi:Predicted arabinose efflux permease, MFS family [Sphingobium sp. AP50]|uniref:spinster family MFS transporter n=1 Tax=Sphingobium sp. AP50 TaxID=1884369 RepID=UPI0008C78FDC|nr:MFS transporter [Sphingobium sp. AP50]SEJ98839.1 Predicted arabinose efflux permease, MFS family [Sphingobium sp. AP50]
MTGNFPARPVLFVLTLFIFVNYLDRYALSILLEPIKQDLGLSDTQIGLLTGAAFALLYSTLAIPVARLAEHCNRMHVLLGAILIWSLGTALCGVAGTFVSFFLARMLVGSGESGAVPPAHAIVGDAFSIERRGTALAIFSLGGALGTALAPMVAGQLETHIGWRGAFLVLGSLGLPVALLLLLIVKDPPRGHSEGLSPVNVAPPPLVLVVRRLFKRRSFALLIPAMVALGLGEYSLFLWLPSYFVRSFGKSPAEVGMLLTLYQGLPLLAGTLLGGLVSDRLIRRDRRWLTWLPALACTLVAAGSALIFLTSDFRWALTLLIVPSTACGLYLGPSYAAIQALAGARSRATATAILTFAVNLLGLGLGPLLIGGTSDLLKARFGDDSLRYAFFLVPPLYLLSALIFLIAARFMLAGIREAEAESRLE